MLNRHLSIWADHSREFYLTNEEMAKSKGGYWNVQEIVLLSEAKGAGLLAVLMNCAPCGRPMKWTDSFTMDDVSVAAGAAGVSPTTAKSMLKAIREMCNRVAFDDVGLFVGGGRHQCRTSMVWVRFYPTYRRLTFTRSTTLNWMYSLLRI